jgi:3-hydroxybutyryl-CoA dehydratase
VSFFSKLAAELSIGETYATRGRTLTEADIVAFAEFSGDWNPHHVDAAFAESTRFGQRIVHGVGVLSVGVALLPFDVEVVEALTGLDRVRFLQPVFIGDTVHTVATVSGLAARRVTLELEIVNQSEVVVCSTEAGLLWR